jgi:hypothetical protein
MDPVLSSILRNRVLGPFPGENTPGVAKNLLIPQFDSPRGAVVAAGAFDKSAVDDDRPGFIASRKSCIIHRGFTIRLCLVPALHLRDGEKKPDGTLQVHFPLAVIVWHGSDDDHILAGIDPLFQLCRSDYSIAATLHLPEELYRTGFDFDFLFKFVFAAAGLAGIRARTTTPITATTGLNIRIFFTPFRVK